MENSQLILIDNIKRLLEKNGMQQKDLCERTGINKSMISGYISGDRAPSFDKIDRIAEAFGVTVEELFINRSHGNVLTKDEKSLYAYLRFNFDAAAVVRLMRGMDEHQTRTVLTIVQGLVDTRFGHK